MNLIAISFILSTVLLPAKPTIPQQEVVDYVQQLAVELDVDANLALAILKAENPWLKWNYVNVNKNKTADIGLWQLNSRYLWTDFVPNYWPEEREMFNPYDWKHSTYVAMRHIQYLQVVLANFNKVILAYNCGINRVKKGKIPESSKEYLKYVKKQYRKLQQIQKQRTLELAQNP